MRLGLRGAALGVRAGLAVTERAIELVSGALAPNPPSAPPRREPRAPARRRDPRSAAPAPEQTREEQEASAATRPEPAVPEPVPEPLPDPPREPAPPAELEDAVVEESAEPGAEEGAGAQIHIAAPWEGYDQLKAADVIAQLPGRDQAELAAVELYEMANRKRQTVIEAAQREHRRAGNG